MSRLQHRKSPASRVLVSLAAALGLALAAVALSACGSSTSNNSSSSSSHDATAVASSVVSPGQDGCPYGGISVETGVDTNGNGKLDSSEVTSTQYLCTPTPGTLTNEATLAVGSSACPLGGVQVQYGIDTNDNGKLDAGEVTSTHTLCGVNGPQPPQGVVVKMGNSLFTPTWGDAGSATSNLSGGLVHVYASSSLPVTTSSPMYATSDNQLTLPATNGSPMYFAVAAVDSAGNEGPLSPTVCGVASQFGAGPNSFTDVPFDPLCEGAVDGQKWTDGEQSIKVVNGALQMTSADYNQEKSDLRGIRPSTHLNLVAGSGNRITTLQADVTVPSASEATRSGAGAINAELVMWYHPAGYTGTSHGVYAILHLYDNGNGLKVGRAIGHCTTSTACSKSDQTTDITYNDGSFPQNGNVSYGTPYTLTLQFDETTDTFTYTINGGVYSNLSGTADASALFTAQGVSYSDWGFAQIRVRALDANGTGGGSGRITATFDNVKMGVNSGTVGPAATPTLYDDFSSGTLDPAKWGTGIPGVSMTSTAGALELDSTATVATANTAAYDTSTHYLSHPEAHCCHMQADFTILSDSGVHSTNDGGRMVMAAYNDGSNGSGTAPDINQAGSKVGDVISQMTVTPTYVNGFVYRCNQFYCGPSTTTLASVTVPTGSVALGLGTTHTLFMSWNPTSHTFSFAVDDGASVCIDPTTTTSSTCTPASTAAPVKGPPNVPDMSVGAPVSVPSGNAVGSSATIKVKVNNFNP